MRIPAVRDFLVDHYFGHTRHVAPILLGSAGIGKSVGTYEAAEQIASKLKLPLVDYTDQAGEELLESGKEAFIFNNLSLVEHEPSDLTGQPREDSRGFVRFRPLLWAKLMSKNPGILFLDDFLDVQRPDLFSAAYKITLERRCGYLKLHDGVMVVLAANTPEVSTLSQMMPAPLANRMTIIRCDPPTVDEWARWQHKKFGDEWDKRTFTFLKRFEEENYICQMPKEPETLHNFPTPRTWTFCSREMLSLKNNNEEVIEGLLGPEVGQKFWAFLKVSVDVDGLINNPSLWHRQNLDAKYMLCLELATWLSKTKDAKMAFPLLEEMASESRQFPILTFLCMSEPKLASLFQVLLKEKPKFSEMVQQVIRDKSMI